jgi:hypothetical protein
MPVQQSGFRPFHKFFNNHRGYIARKPHAESPRTFNVGDQVYVTCGPYTGTRTIKAVGRDWYAINHQGHQVYVSQSLCEHPSQDPNVQRKLYTEDQEQSYLESARESEQERLARNPRPFGYKETRRRSDAA